MAFVGPLAYGARGRHRTVVDVRAVKPGGVCLRRRRVATLRPICMSVQSTAKSSSLESFLKVQNGSDVRGVVLDLNPEEPVTLTPEYGAEIAAAFARFVAEKTRKDVKQVRIALGRDSRISGPELLAKSANAIQSTGATAVDFGLASTPAMFMSAVLGNEPFDGAIELTASHLPSNRNGLKFFTVDGGASKGDVRKILQDAAEKYDARGGRPIENIGAEPEKQDFMADYSNHLVNLIRRGCNHPDHYDEPLRGVKILVDAGNGAGGFFVSRVLNQLGADTTGSQFLDPDGGFPNHVPNPEDNVAMRMTSEAVASNSAELGIVFDTDVDRSAVVDANGNEINKNRLIAVMASIVLNEHPNSTIVTDSVTSSGLADFIRSKGGKHFRYRRGYKNVIDKGIELNDKGEECHLAIETSGHGAMRENYMLDDGAYLAVKIIIELVRLKKAEDPRGIAALYEGLKEPREASEFRLKFKDPSIDFKSYGAKLLDEFAEYGKSVPSWELEKENYEGYRFTVAEQEGQSGWLLLRQSLHDPLLALNVESEAEGGLKKIVADLLPFLEKYDQLDLSKLRAAA